MIVKIIVKEKDVKPIDALFFRAFVFFCLGLSICKWRGIEITWHSKNTTVLIFRGLSSVGTTLFDTFGTLMLSLTIRQAIFDTTPFFISLWAILLVKEYISKTELIAMIVNFFIIMEITLTQDKNAHPTGSEEQYGTYALGCTLAFVATILGAFYVASARRLQDEHPMIVMLSCSVFTVPTLGLLSFVTAIKEDNAWRLFSYAGSQYGWMCLSVVVFLMAAFSQVIAFQNERSGLLALLQFAIVYAYIIDYTVFDVVLSTAQFCGLVALVIVSTVILVVKLRQQQGEAKPLLKEP